jgi:DNA-binding CsgD family transcriptional regulator
MSKQVAVVNLLDTLTEHEQGVFNLLFAGAERLEIAGVLNISMGTVKYHLAHIYEKLDVRGRAEAVAYAASVGKVVKVGGADKECVAWGEAEIRDAAARLVKQGLGDRKAVNAVITDLLLALHGHI